ncbi:Gfo/Idh/MocA family oxidoreductase [Solitalea sp. MAHUQ-68]|uniref:Gfo/Idh/MocA family oxidoreductase n=1 Tax=Solitalea agri TaxID=2953739 RepID=A0A9X2F2U2_9SPHI|nr:Gfo/Idh/MocA family oxidoreductase [Solitalea agri]MCO4293684.1 Gfo/Idh/MocA family oxidoreductase [Solitalea agri]
MIKVGLIGAGKMGISHLSILGAHPDAEVVGVCDTSKLVLDVLNKYTPFPCFSDHKKMLEVSKPDAVFVSVPTKFHYEIVKDLLSQSIHVFAEKPFCLTAKQGAELVELAKQKGLINQVGYHNKFIGTFNEVKNILNSGSIGDIYHFIGESYGPVVVKKKQDNWRSNASEGGGCLMDYASHVIDLINYLISPVKNVKSSLLKPIFSEGVEDSVFSLLELENNVSGVLSVNWSDDTYRKMSTQLTILGKKGKIVSDANELKVFFKEDNCPEGYTKGWNVKYITDFAEEVDFYLRGEEYSAQVDYFIKAIQGKVPNNKNTFESAWKTDLAIELIKLSA